MKSIRLLLYVIKVVGFKKSSVLSQRLIFLVRDGVSVKHYRIRPLDQGGYFIARRTTFSSLNELVQHYSKEADGLCVVLGKPPSRLEIPQTSTFTFDDQWEVDRRSIKLVCQIGSGQFGEVSLLYNQLIYIVIFRYLKADGMEQPRVLF